MARPGDRRNRQAVLTDVIWKDVDYMFVDMPPEPVTCP